ncbi:hypothetical protein [Futiania mangrovi]|uniref:Uncharacterized protein n=1 Tax=Futiania mangrovi TaxID=2959716 RepID=A0A9J6PA69_9PROT|nr:hypothetical protein [Futiania mangrovii]MCP1335909.1 hypothetical protein [Futiania mangrovii]
MQKGAAERKPGETDDELLHKVGTGNWRAVRLLDYPVDRILEAAGAWKAQAAGIVKPWLVWCAHPDWAVLQQKLVLSAGWTPIVGFDPRVSHVPIVPGSLRIDFNEQLQLPLMYPHFPVELAFMWIDKIAFWHSDFLLAHDMMERVATQFESLPQGECFVTHPGHPIRTRLKWLLNAKDARYWELLGCTTKEASKSQWDNGTSWWMNFQDHPNCPDKVEYERRAKCYYDHGSGIRYWHQKCGGRVRFIYETEIAHGHFTKIGNPDFKRSIPAGQSDSLRLMEQDMSRNFGLVEAAKKMRIEDLLSSD